MKAIQTWSPRRAGQAKHCSALLADEFSTVVTQHTTTKEHTPCQVTVGDIDSSSQHLPHFLRQKARSIICTRARAMRPPIFTSSMVKLSCRSRQLLRGFNTSALTAANSLCTTKPRSANDDVKPSGIRRMEPHASSISLSEQEPSRGSPATTKTPQLVTSLGTLPRYHA